ncbi:hypothetical protein [Nocardia sp. NPDC052566]|uniref:hypothetical protein n=1 Tax=Nocardia sp. NPDC052566 TaxID=3364330 RepID=UPI0037C7E4AD
MSGVRAYEGRIGAAVRGFVDGLLRFDRAIVHSLSGLDAEESAQPIIVILQAYQSLLGGMRPQAQVCAAVRRMDTGGLTELESAHLDVVRELLHGAYDSAGETLLQISKQFPADELAVAAGHQVDFLQGDNETRLHRLSSSPMLLDRAAPGYPYLLAMLAFAYSENQEHGKAYEAGTLALSLAPHDNPWAVHACAHSLFETRDYQDVSRLLSSTQGNWSSDDCLLRTHLSWHFALNAMATHDEAALARLTGDLTAVVRQECSAMQFCDLVSLLWRLRLTGREVAADFDSTLDTAIRLQGVSNSAFVDMHILLAVIGGGRYDLARQMAREMCAESADVAPHLRSVRRTAVDVAESFLHYCQSDPVQAVRQLLSVYPALIAVGGSEIQRDLVLELLITCDLDRTADPSLFGTAGLDARPLVTRRIA